MLFTLEALKAKEGDCLLLHWGDPDDPRLALIDGGPGNVYESFLRPRLDEIIDNRGLDELVIELAMVSHVDGDHIVGVKKLFARLAADAGSNSPSPIRIERLWHNTFDDIIGNALNEHYQKFTASFTAAADGEPDPGTVNTLAKAVVARDPTSATVAGGLAEDIALVLAGHADGRRLRDDHKTLHDKGLIRGLNRPFANTLITAELTPDKFDFLGLTMQIIGPLQPEIDALQADFDKYIHEHDLATGQAALAAYADKSIPNLSSIVCLVEAEVGVETKSILLTGDARGDRILAGLRQQGLLAEGPGAKLHVTVLKAPHHGSDRNVELGFFEAISADIYVFSGDGKHGNPEHDTLDWIIASRAKSDEYTLVFTYPIADIDAKRKQEAGSKWDDEADSLERLLEDRKQAGFAFEVIEDAPICIDLGSDALDF